jgi:FkbM family methyltransferase
MKRTFRSLKSTLRDILRWRHVTADWSSWIQVVADVLRLKMGGQVTNVERSIRLRSGKTIYYRLNKGDLWSMREVLLDECYRFPGVIRPEVVLDLGGNIGLTSLWLDSCFQPRKLVAVEPFPENARLARKNLAQSVGEVVIVEAAAGSSDGFADFSAALDSNRGSVSFGTNGKTRVVSIPTLLQETGIGHRIDLLKVDIEGGEAELFSKNFEWLDGVQNIIVEFHPDIIDVVPITEAICSRGFQHIPPGSVFAHNMEAFVRL